MSKVLTFNDGHTVSFSDDSTITSLFTVVNTYSDIDTMASYFTPENLIGATFDGQLFNTVIPVSMEATSFYDSSNVTVHFTNRYKTDVEILQEQMVEVQEALVELAEG